MNHSNAALYLILVVLYSQERNFFIISFLCCSGIKQFDEWISAKTLEWILWVTQLKWWSVIGLWLVYYGFVFLSFFSSRRMFHGVKQNPWGKINKTLACSLDPIHVHDIKLLTLAERKKDIEKKLHFTPCSNNFLHLNRLFPIDKIHIFIRTDFLFIHKNPRIETHASPRERVDEGKLSERTEKHEGKRKLFRCENRIINFMWKLLLLSAINICACLGLKRTK
jgi:hypothetical protein